MSCIIDPLGNVLVEPDFSGETIQLAELDRRIIARGKYDLDVVGHYVRPDIFSLSVDARPKPVVAFTLPPGLSIVAEADAENEAQGGMACSD
ncbi:hypothetical protein VVT58_03640 [Sphingobium sp. SJ10-10]|uniref:hypothetical protein n=1 Tax=Sphingobium sp. SJ10-10 TaxID=3114999 RepID=UPI002E176B6F|nr:hypothetical protein [Sphingobium sp. SJ10-10]